MVKVAFEKTCFSPKLVGLFRLDDHLSRARGGRKFDVQRGEVFLFDLDALDLLELLDARLHFWFDLVGL